MIDDAVTLIRPLADSRSIHVAVTAREHDTYITADRQRCSQVLLNLLSNAVKYNNDGGTVEVWCQRTSEHALRISVHDDGPGIDPARQDRLFGPFERLGAEESSADGAGLGSALTKQLIERMDGSIGIETQLGLGSTFWIELPIANRPTDRQSAD